MAPLQCTGRLYEILKNMREKRESLIIATNLQKKKKNLIVKSSNVKRKKEKKENNTSSTRVVKDILADMKSARDFLLSAIESHKTSASYYNHATTQSSLQNAQSTSAVNAEDFLLSSRADDDSFCRLETLREEAPIQDTSMTDTDEESNYCYEEEEEESTSYGKIMSHPLYSKRSNNNNNHYRSWMYASTNSVGELHRGDPGALYHDVVTRRNVSEINRRTRNNDKKIRKERQKKSKEDYVSQTNNNNVDSSNFHSNSSSTDQSLIGPKKPISRRLTNLDNDDNDDAHDNNNKLTDFDVNNSKISSEKKKRRIRVVEKRKKMAKIGKDINVTRYLSTSSISLISEDSSVKRPTLTPIYQNLNRTSIIIDELNNDNESDDNEMYDESGIDDGGDVDYDDDDEGSLLVSPDSSDTDTDSLLITPTRSLFFASPESESYFLSFQETDSDGSGNTLILPVSFS